MSPLDMIRQSESNVFWTIGGLASGFRTPRVFLKAGDSKSLFTF
jgi:hypothetical protein